MELLNLVTYIKFTFEVNDFHMGVRTSGEKIVCCVGLKVESKMNKFQLFD